FGHAFNGSTYKYTRALHDALPILAVNTTAAEHSADLDQIHRADGDTFRTEAGLGDLLTLQRAGGDRVVAVVGGNQQATGQQHIERAIDGILRPSVRGGKEMLADFTALFRYADKTHDCGTDRVLFGITAVTQQLQRILAPILAGTVKDLAPGRVIGLIKLTVQAHQRRFGSGSHPVGNSVAIDLVATGLQYLHTIEYFTQQGLHLLLRVAVAGFHGNARILAGIGIGDATLVQGGGGGVFGDDGVGQLGAIARRRIDKDGRLTGVAAARLGHEILFIQRPAVLYPGVDLFVGVLRQFLIKTGDDLTRLVAFALGQAYLCNLAAQLFVQQVHADVLHALQVAAQIGLFLAQGVIPLRAFLGLQAVFGTGAGLHGHDQAFVGQLLQQLGYLGADNILALVEIINQQVAEHVSGSAYSAVSGGIGGQFTDQ